MPGQPYKAAAIVGAAEANEIGYLQTPKTALPLHIEAIRNVCDQTGIPVSRIDGCSPPAGAPSSASTSAFSRSYIDTTAVGGCSFEMHVHHALAAIHAGIIEVALISHGENGYSARKIGGGAPATTAAARARWTPAAELTMAYGLSGAPSNYAHAMVRHMHRYGTHARGLRAHRRHPRLGDPQPPRGDALQGQRTRSAGRSPWNTCEQSR
jgi:hypothetical protein